MNPRWSNPAGVFVGSRRGYLPTWTSTTMEPGRRRAKRSGMKTAFILLVIALMILPAIVTVRIMVTREKKRLRDEQNDGSGPAP